MKRVFPVILVSMVLLGTGFSLGNPGRNSRISSGYLAVEPAYAGFTRTLPRNRALLPFERFERYRDQGEWDSAVKVLTAILRENKRLLPYVNAAFAELEIARGETTSAMVYAASAAATLDRAVARSAARLLAGWKEAAGETAVAFRIYGRLAAAPENDRRFEDAMEAERLRMRLGDTQTALMHLKRLLKHERNPQRRARIVEQVLAAENPSSIKTLRRYADAYYTAGDFPKARRLYYRAFSIARSGKRPSRGYSRGEAELIYRQARSEERADDFRTAIRTYKKIRAHAPKYRPEEIYYRIGLCYQRLGKDRTGEKYFRKALRATRKPRHRDDIWYRMALRRDNRKHRKEAVAFYSKILKHHSRSSWADDAAWRIGLGLLEDGKEEAALAAFEKALKRYPRSDYAPAFAYWRGRILERMGRRAEAAAAYAAVLETPGMPYYRARAVEGFERLGAELPDTMEKTAKEFYERGETIAGMNRLRVVREIGTNERSVAAARQLRKWVLESPPWGALAEATGGAFESRILSTIEGARGNEVSKERLEEIEALIGIGAFGLAGQELLATGVTPPDQPEKRVMLARLMAEAGRYREAIREVGSVVEASPVPVDPLSVPPLVADLWYPHFYADLARREARRYGIDTRLILAVIREESRFQADVASWAGARGLMQIMPSTGRMLAKSTGLEDFHVSWLNRPEINLRLGVHYLNNLAKMYGGRWFLALAGYNAGPGNTNRWVRQFPVEDEESWIERIEFRETRRYVKKVLGTYAIYRQLDGERLRLTNAFKTHGEG